MLSLSSTSSASSSHIHNVSVISMLQYSHLIGHTHIFNNQPIYSDSSLIPFLFSSTSLQNLLNLSHISLFSRVHDGHLVGFQHEYMLSSHLHPIRIVCPPHINETNMRREEVEVNEMDLELTSHVVVRIYTRKLTSS